VIEKLQGAIRHEHMTLPNFNFNLNCNKSTSSGGGAAPGGGRLPTLDLLGYIVLVSSITVYISVVTPIGCW